MLSKTEVSVQVIREVNNRVTLSIKDNGTGFSPGGNRDGMGLRNMRERAEALPGGVFKLESMRGNGAQVTVTYDTKIAQ